MHDSEFLALIEKYNSLIYKACYFYCNNKDDIPDLYQDIVMNIWLGYQHLRDRQAIPKWIYQIVLNVSFRFLRKQKMKPIEAELTEVIIESYEETEPNKVIDQLYQLMKHLDQVESSIIFLYLEGHSHQEIADITGFSITNVGTKIQRIKEKMKKINQQTL